MQKLARHVISELANSLTIDDYKYSDTQVINMFKDAVDPTMIQIESITDDSALESVKNKFESANEPPSCPF